MNIKIFEQDDEIADYHEAVKLIRQTLYSHIDKTDAELFESLKKINTEYGNFFDLEDLDNFINNFREKQNHEQTI